MAGNFGSQVIAWYGDLLDQYIDDAPDAVRWWLQLGFNLTEAKHRLLPDRNNHPSGQVATNICLDTVTTALNNFHEAALTSIFLPSEPFIAMGVRPVSAEAISNFASGAHAERGFAACAEQTGIPETYCSYHKVLMGMASSGVLEKPRMLASCSLACDANNLSFKALSQLWGIEHTYVDVPYDISEDSIAYVADELRELTVRAEDIFGRKADKDMLQAAVARSQNTLLLLAQSLPKRAGKYLNSDMLLAVEELLDAHVALGTKDMELMAHQMIEDYAAAIPYKGLSLVWVHTTPFFLPELSHILDHSKAAQIIASDMLLDQVCTKPGGWLYDGATSPFEAMAERLICCSFNGPALRRAKRIRWICEQTHADGAVIFCHWGCKETAGAAQLIRHTLERAGFPALVLDGDGCERSNNMHAQMTTRFEAFLEVLRHSHQTC